MIPSVPHGGRLINRVASNQLTAELLERCRFMKRIVVDSKTLCDLYMIGIGAFSPLQGFMGEKDYGFVLSDMRLETGLVWPLPITLAIDNASASQLRLDDEVVMVDSTGTIRGVIEVTEIYTYDKEKEVMAVFRTADPTHPGVKYLLCRGDYLVGGRVTVLPPLPIGDFPEFWATPVDTRKEFQSRGWKRVVGFQTRNPIHRAHEYIIKTAMEVVDGLYLNPLVGETKPDDIPADVRMKCYEVILDKYFPTDRVFIGVYPAYMRYAGPREAVFHALVRKNYGCTHFIIGRDHAGVGNFYGPYDAHELLDSIGIEELGITPLFFENSFYCRRCYSMCTVKTCPHGQDERFYMSGTKVRQMLSRGVLPPPEFTRPEVANILLDWWRGSRSD